MHTSEYRDAKPFSGQRVVVVGAGNSAVQVAVELAEHAQVTLATRHPVKFAPQRPFGRDIHFWSAAAGFDHLPIGHLLRTPPASAVIDAGAYRSALAAERPDQRRMFTAVDGADVVWLDGQRESVDAIVLATGFRPGLSYLRDLGALDDRGAPQHNRGLSTVLKGLGYVGLEWQRSFASATLRGVGRDAEHVVRRLTGSRAPSRARCCQSTTSD